MLELIRAFFELEANRIVLNFVHGLVFLLLGFAAGVLSLLRTAGLIKFGPARVNEGER